VELDRATRSSLKRQFKLTAPPTSQMDSLRARALAAMTAEKARGEARQEAATGGQGAAWRTFVPLASAAALALAFGSMGKGGGTAGGNSDTVRAGFGEDLLGELVAMHSRPLPPERTDPKEVRALEQYVGVPVHPATFEKAGARLVGGRILPVNKQNTAMLQYVIGSGAGQQRVSVFIYDPSKIQVQSAQLAARAVGTSEVRVGKQNGYSVAITQRDGVGYAVASELDADHSAQLAALADQD
jgi:anti-sigma factor RsiW